MVYSSWGFRRFWRKVEPSTFDSGALKDKNMLFLSGSFQQ